MCKSTVDTSTLNCQCDKGKPPVDSLVKPDFPICQTAKKIPWSIAERAYEAYVKRYGRCQTLERIAQRGGFYTEEMDLLYPAWREEVEEIYLLRKRVDALTLDNASQHAALHAIATVCEQYQNRDFDGEDYEELQQAAFQMSMDVVKITFEATRPKSV